MAFDRQDWRDACVHLEAAAARERLHPEDRERLAESAYLIGDAQASQRHWALAHNEWSVAGDVERAARCAFWLAFMHLNAGVVAAAGGWIDRAVRMLDEAERECVERGYLNYCLALAHAFGGDIEAAQGKFSDAAKAAELFDDRALRALARIGEGRCLIYTGDVARGTALLDEAMVAVEAHEVPAIVVGDAYCTVIEACRELLDLPRARTWTAALSRWCESHPQLVLYRGRCLVHRAEILLFHGAWADAIEEIDRALSRLVDPLESSALGEAFYVRAELLRLRGEFEAAADAYRQANEIGRIPQPGLALLRLAEGRTTAALAMIRRVLGEATDPFARSLLLAPHIEISLVAGDVEGARTAARELEAIASMRTSTLLSAYAAGAAGRVCLAEGDAGAALSLLRRAWRDCRDLEIPFEAARIRTVIAEACVALGDHDGADMELDAARSVFADLGAAPELVRMMDAPEAPAGPITGGLTPRELAVLRLIATGATNRSIARELMISEKTVASHVSHIFTKLQVPSRAAATAYAYSHGVV